MQDDDCPVLRFAPLFFYIMMAFVGTHVGGVDNFTFVPLVVGFAVFLVRGLDGLYEKMMRLR